jgi:cytochrome c peroxidase
MFFINIKNVIIFLLFSTVAFSSEHHEAKELFDEAKCMRCHNSNDFRHDEERVYNFKRLNHSVHTCATNNNAGWFEEDEHSVSKYLNHKYYHYKNIPEFVEE